jgi:septation ring formation regulator EzrA
MTKATFIEKACQYGNLWPEQAQVIHSIIQTAVRAATYQRGRSRRVDAIEPQMARARHRALKRIRYSAHLL